METRADFESKYGTVYNTKELREHFEVKGFGMGLVVVKRKSDNVLGSMDFSHMPRYYYNFKESF